MDKHAIIKLKREGHSNRKVAKMLHVNRKTVARYWIEYCSQLEALATHSPGTKIIQEKICSEPTYDSTKRNAVNTPRKLIHISMKFYLMKKKNAKS